MRSSASSRGGSRSRRDVKDGAPAFVIVGLPDRACAEARQRVRSGITSAELEFPRRPRHRQPRAGRPAQGGLGLRPADRARRARRVAAAAARRARPARVGRRARARRAAAPRRRRPRGRRGRAADGARARRSARRESARRGGARGHRADRRSGTSPTPSRICAASSSPTRSCRRARDDAVAPLPDLADVRGQERARRALEIAAAGGHNLLLAGPPGTGKTMLARRLPGILPPLERDGGARGDAHPLGRRAARGRAAARRRPPFRAPHHSASTAAIVGGGPGIRPGRGEPRAPRRPAPRRAGGVRAADARGAAAAARGRRRLDRARRRPRGLPGALSARRRR